MNLVPVRRAIIHIPHGILAGLGMLVCPLSGFAFVLGFIAYEIVQDWRKGDQAHKDLMGMLIGLAGVLVYAIIRDFPH